jgi:hypothetical protein
VIHVKGFAQLPLNRCTFFPALIAQMHICYTFLYRWSIISTRAHRQRPVDAGPEERERDTGSRQRRQTTDDRQSAERGPI